MILEEDNWNLNNALQSFMEQSVSNCFFFVIWLRSSYILIQGRGFTINPEEALVQEGPACQADCPWISIFVTTTYWTHSKPLSKDWVIVDTPSKRSRYFFSKTHQTWESGEHEEFQNHFRGSHMEGSSSRSQEVSHQEWGLAKLCYAHLLRAVRYLFLILCSSFEN